MNLPPSIKEYVPLEYTKRSEAYVYRYTNLNNGMMYIGYHVGIPEDTYLESSMNSDFRTLMASSEPVFKYEILYVGSKTEMQNQEHKMLKEVNAVSNPNYYNGSNGTPSFSYKGLDIEKCIDIDRRRRDGEFDVGKKPIEDWADVPRFQGRADELDLKSVRKIKGLIEAKGGNTDICDPIFIVNDELINGNHTLTAASEYTKVIDIPVAILPDDIAMILSELEIDYLSKLANKEDEKHKTSNSKKDIVKTLVKNKLADAKFDFDSARCLSILEGLLVRTKTEQNSIKKMAKSQYIYEKNRLEGKVRINWELKLNKAIISAKCDDLRDSNTLAYSVSSGHTNKLDTEFISRILLNPTKPFIVIVVHHPSDEAEKTWQKTLASQMYNRFTEFFEYMVTPEIDGVPVERTIRFVTMESYKYDRTLAN